jgi:hypothetical protein
MPIVPAAPWFLWATMADCVTAVRDWDQTRPSAAPKDNNDFPRSSRDPGTQGAGGHSSSVHLGSITLRTAAPEHIEAKA